ncbi:MAG TPA: DUF6152 family protein [Gammaproteobacteria bacterium]|nr:DUF6152 family protein [Gammaproteobacteria bacterium]
MKLKSLALVLVGGMAFGGTASAHHSFAGSYLTDVPPVKVEGTLVQFLLRNPHSYVQMEVKDPKSGQLVRWSIEWGAAGQLAQSGIANDSLKVGDHVLVTGMPSRHAGDHRLRMSTIERPAANGVPEFEWHGRFR